MLAQLFCFTLVTSGQFPPGVDLARIDRVLRVEPTYKTSNPKYGLFVFGPNAATRIWVVKDGNTLHVDRNGNGDLTEPGEQLTGANWFPIGDIVERDGKTTHRGWTVSAFSDAFRSTITSARLGRQMTGNSERLRFGDRPANAPIVHFDGPLTLARYSKILPVRRTPARNMDERASLRVMMGSPGLGAGTFAACQWNCVENRGALTAEFDYPSAADASKRHHATGLLPTFT